MRTHHVRARRDFDGDGRDDALLATSRGKLQQLIATGGGTFTPGAITEAKFDSPRRNEDERPRCRVGDLDADGRSDLLCVFVDDDGTAQFGTARALPDGGFAPKRTPIPAGLPLRKLQFALGDVDASGTADLVLAVKTDTTWLLATGAVDAAGKVSPGPTGETKWAVGPERDKWELTSVDIDGDARADVALTHVAREGPPFGGPRRRLRADAVHIATSSPGGTTAFAARPEPIRLEATYTAIADADGDGRADIMTGAPVGEALADRKGGYEPWSKSAEGDEACGENNSVFVEVGKGGGFLAVDAGHPPSTVDVNGDDRADRLCVADLNGDPFRARDIVTRNRPADLHRWMPADVSGTGRRSLVYVHFRNPGYEVYTLTPDDTGGFTRDSKEIKPKDGMPLKNPYTAGWMPLEAGAPDRAAPDGRADLVMMERDGQSGSVSRRVPAGSGRPPPRGPF